MSDIKNKNIQTRPTDNVPTLIVGLVRDGARSVSPIHFNESCSPGSGAVLLDYDAFILTAASNEGNVLKSTTLKQ